jgi:hypothetical protein
MIYNNVFRSNRGDSHNSLNHLNDRDSAEALVKYEGFIIIFR